MSNAWKNRVRALICKTNGHTWEQESKNHTFDKRTGKWRPVLYCTRCGAAR